MLQVDLVVAMDSQNGIGKAGELPWQLSADLRHFRDVTTRSEHPPKRNAVIMGRRTWLSIPSKFRPLPDRINVILSRDPAFQAPEGALKAQSLTEADHLLARDPVGFDRAFVIGGQQIYELALRETACRRIYLTRVHRRFDCDAFFPTLPPEFQEISAGPVLSENGLDYSFHIFEYVPLPASGAK